MTSTHTPDLPLSRETGRVLDLYPSLVDLKPLCQWELLAHLFHRPKIVETLRQHPLWQAVTTERLESTRPFEAPLRVSLTLRSVGLFALGMPVKTIIQLDGEAQRSVYRRIAEYVDLAWKLATPPSAAHSRWEFKDLLLANLADDLPLGRHGRTVRSFVVVAELPVADQPRVTLWQAGPS
ncbi:MULTISPECIES: hypothetical protein [unclassified Crossiella]|uniref:hypothetical protein n=1 Tax=unclassified Crossiella TaxID=2620835 RepID=UPI001FFFCB78|nr:MULTISPECIES: hypothetical protein [unclassified Crossiella]MCK2239740.1 hypothetical protein [Crossiella sp. S99.2]MCK2252435.1 hypothetical protein [Crossiella sp. S99.1]